MRHLPTPQKPAQGHVVALPVPDWPARGKEVGVEFISAVVCQPAHTQFFVVETDDYNKLYELFRPFQGIATADITPVRDLMLPQ